MTLSEALVPYYPSDPIRGGTDLQERLLGVVSNPEGGSDSETTLRRRMLDLFNDVFGARHTWHDQIVTREELLADFMIKTQKRSQVLVFEIKWKDVELPMCLHDCSQLSVYRVSI